MPLSEATTSTATRVVSARSRVRGWSRSVWIATAATAWVSAFS